MTDEQPSLRPRCDVAIVFAVALEADAFERRAASVQTFEADGAVVHQGEVSGRGVVWCVGGVGRERAARAARLLIQGHHPRLVVSAGFAGGLAPTLPRGKAVQSSRSIVEQGAEAVSLATGSTHKALTILTVDRIVDGVEAKRDLFTATGAEIVDMETHAVAVEASREGLPCASVRVVSDDAGQDLPREVARLVRPQSSLRRLGTALGAIGRRPSAALDMWRLYENAVVDGKTLAAALVDLVAAQPATNPPAT
jgi:adenosylhomocysteine nucleosidase